MDPETKTSSEAKERIKRKFLQLFNNMTKGCGRDFCTSEYCKSNPMFEMDDQKKIAAIAMRQAATNDYICDKYTGPKTLQSTSFIIPEGNLSPEAVKEFSVRLLEVFSDYDCLSYSFFLNGDTKVEIDDIYSYMDYPFLTNIMNLLTILDKADKEQNLMKKISKQIENHVDHMLDLIRKDKIKNPADLRLLAVVIGFPLLFEYDYHPILHSYLRCFVNLNEKSEVVLTNWFTTLPKAEVKRSVEAIVNTISIQIVTNYDEIYIQNLLKFSRFLYNANKSSKHISFDEFYIETITQEIDPKEQYEIWISNKHEKTSDFTFLSYPWALECAFKQLCLDRESLRQMQVEIRKNLVNGMNLMLNPTDIYLIIKVRRNNLIEDTFNAIASSTVNPKKPMKVQFAGEQGIDEGGVRKELFLLLTKQLITVDYGMFVAKANDRYLWFNGQSFDPPINFELTGMLLGLSIYNSITLDLAFPMDIKEFEPEIYNSLKYILEYDGNIEEDIGVNFQVDYKVFDDILKHDLIPDAENTMVTQKNKYQYVNLHVDWILSKSIEDKYKSFHKGFWKVAEGDIINMLEPQELQILIMGSPHLDFSELQRVTRYDDGYTKESQAIKYFWNAVHSFDENQKKKLLMFISGSDRAPIKGLGDMMFIITRNGPDSEILPSAHTCFNHLLLPDYSSEEKLKQKLLLAISNSEGFGLA